MRRLWVLAVVLTAGCGDFFSAHADLAAKAGPHELTTVELGNLLGRIKNLQLTPEAADLLSNIWVDYTLFAQAAAEGTLPEDSAAVAEVMWPELAEIKADRWYEALMARRAPVSDAVADSVYRADSVRVLQHILIRVPQGAQDAQRTAARRTAQEALAKVQRGEDFGAVAGEYSGDPGSRMDHGFLPPSPKGAFVAAFDSAAWSLGEGEVSGLVYTPFGIHIIKRPRREAIRERLTDWIREAAQRTMDSLYLKQLAADKDLKVSGSAPALVRQALDDEQGMRQSSKKLATFTGGAFTVADFLRWVPALGPVAARQIRQAGDEQLTDLVTQLGQNRLVLDQADSAGMQPSELQWLGVRQSYDAQVDTLKLLLRLDGDVTDPSLDEAARRQVVRLKIDQFFTRVAEGTVRLRPMPSLLATVLREREGYEVNIAAVNRAVEVAQGDSTKSGAKGPLQPATGPPPIPGAAPADSQ